MMKRSCETKPIWIKCLLICVFACTGCFSADHKDCNGIGECRRIIGGTKTSIKQFPFLVSIIVKTRLDIQGAAIIVSQHWALTAAHCVNRFPDNFINHGFLYLRGNTDVWRNSSGEQYLHQIIEKHVHPDFSKAVINDCDIAILKVKRPFGGPNEKPVKIAGRRFGYGGNTRATVAGWGTTNFALQAAVDHIRMVTIQVFSDNFCKHTYKKVVGFHITDNMLCGGAKNGGKDACSGDSGGPLVRNNVLIGLVSNGINCGLSKFPGIYTKVGRFQNWLESLEDRLDVSFHIKYVQTQKIRKVLCK